MNDAKMQSDCRHKWQDEQYGAGMRVHNPCANEKMRCTVCGETKSAPKRKEVSK